MRSLRLVLYQVIGLLLGALLVVASANAQTTSGLTFPVTIRIPPSVPASVGTGWDAVVPGTDWTYDYRPPGNGDATVTRPNNVKLGGQIVPIDAKRTLPAEKLAKLGRGLARVGGPLALGLALTLIWDEVSQRWLTDEPEESPGSEIYYAYTSGWVLKGSAADPLDACKLVDAQTQFIGPASGDPPTHTCTRLAGSTWMYPGYAVKGCVAPASWSGGKCVLAGTHREATDVELEDAIYVELVSRGMGSELARRLVDAGYEPSMIPDFDPVQTSGPASVPGETTTSTTTTPAGTTTTSTTKQRNLEYDGDTVTVTETETTTTTNPDGSTTTETTTTTPSPGQTGQSEPDEQYSLSYGDSQFPDVPDLYERQFPDGFSGVWSDRKAELEATSLFSLVSALTTGAPSGGTCPSWNLNLDMPGVVMLGSHTLAPPCDVWPFVRAVLILTALFVARRLIFGG